MRLWEFLKARMEPFKERIAFYGAKLTYADLLRFGETKVSRKKIRLIVGRTHEETAVEILKCIAEGDVAAPAAIEYGERHIEKIREAITSAKDGLDDLAFVMFTSGTTGYPKGVMLTEENIISNLESISAYFRVENCRSICIARPLAHISAITGELLFALITGLTVCFYEDRFMPKRVLGYLKENGIDVFCATPTYIKALANAQAQCDNRFPKVVAISGENLSEQDGKTIRNAFPDAEFYNVYGLTEHSPRALALLPSDFAHNPHSVGKPIQGVEAKIENGELLLRSQSVMKGYLSNEKATEQKIKDGWLYTGDMAHMDTKGNFYIDGRRDGMMIRAGINVYPEEIESVAKRLDGIDECVAYGKTTKAGSIICLNYSGTVEPVALRRWLLQELEPMKVPAIIEKRQEFPRTPSGKIIRQWKRNF